MTINSMPTAVAVTLIATDPNFTPFLDEKIRIINQSRSDVDRSKALDKLAGDCQYTFSNVQKVMKYMPETSSKQKLLKYQRYYHIAQIMIEDGLEKEANTALSEAERLVSMLNREDYITAGILTSLPRLTKEFKEKFKDRFESSLIDKARKISAVALATIFKGVGKVGAVIGTKIVNFGASMFYRVCGERCLYHKEIREDLKLPIINAILVRLLDEHLWEFDGVFRVSASTQRVNDAEKQLKNKNLKDEQDVRRVIRELHDDQLGKILIGLLKKICNSVGNPQSLQHTRLPILLEKVFQSKEVCKYKFVTALHTAFPISRNFWRKGEGEQVSMSGGNPPPIVPLKERTE
jgi:hypothetical protein